MGPVRFFRDLVSFDIRILRKRGCHKELDYRRLTATYSRLGRIEYAPRLLFKIELYSCARGIHTTREAVEDLLTQMGKLFAVF